MIKGRHNSVLSCMKKVQPNVLDIGSIFNMANLCYVHGVTQLLLPVEELLIDVFFHFNNSAKRKEEYREFLEFCDEGLFQFNTIFQTDATQIAILLPEMNHLFCVFMAKFVTMRAIKCAEDLTTVPFADKGQ